MKKTLFLATFLFTALWAENMLLAQKNTTREYPTGLLDDIDTKIVNAPIQVPMTGNAKRSGGSANSLKKYAPTPGDQAQYGTCGAWAVGYCARTIIEAYRDGITDQQQIDKMAFSPAFIFRVTVGDKDATWRMYGRHCWGSMLSDLCDNLKEKGIPLQQEFPHLCVDEVSDIPNDIFKKAQPNNIQGYVQLWNEEIYKSKSQHDKVAAVKTSINNGKPVVIAQFTTMSFNFMPSNGYWAPLASEAPGTYQGAHGRHAMCIIGYDDSVNGGSFEVQNSWGTDWGNKGRFWLSYEVMNQYVYAAIEFQSLPEVKPKEVINLAGAFSLNLMDNKPMPAMVNGNAFKLKDAYASGTRFRMYIDNNEPAYVYAFGADGTDKTFQIFPHLPNITPLLDYKYAQIAIPDEEHTIRMDGTVGTDYFCVLYSKKPLNLEDIRKKIEAADRTLTFEGKLQKVLGDKLITNPEMSVDNKGFMRFKASSNTGAYIVPIITEMKHI